MKGPFSRSIIKDVSYEYSVWYQTNDGQAKRTPLPYQQSAGVTQRAPGTPATAIDSINTDVSYYTQQWGRDNSALQTVDFNCYKNLVKKVGPAVQMGMNLAQLGPTIQLFKGLGGALVSPLKTVGTLMKNASKRGGGKRFLLGEVPDAYLAFQFGVKPLMQDVYAAAQIWNSPKFKGVPIMGHASLTYPYAVIRGSNAWSYNETYKVAVKRVCTISIRNPNLASLQQWGLLNPAVVAWDMLPFSFVLDWFVPIGSWLSSFTDFAGIDVDDPYCTRFCRGAGTQTYDNGPYPPNWQWTTTSRKWDRRLGLNSPAFPTHVNLRLGSGQLVTSGALLLQNLKLWR